MKTEKEMKEKLMEYLYDEMETSERDEFRDQLEKNPNLMKEFREMKKTRSLLNKFKTEPPSFTGSPFETDISEKLNFQKRKTRHLWISLAAAATILLTLLFLFSQSLQFGKTGDGFYVILGNPPQTETQQLDSSEIVTLLQQVQVENIAMIRSAMQENRQQLEQAVNELTVYQEQRRLEDLMLISEGFAEFEQQTATRLRRTDQTIDQLIYALSNE